MMLIWMILSRYCLARKQKCDLFEFGCTEAAVTEAVTEYTEIRAL